MIGASGGDEVAVIMGVPVGSAAVVAAVVALLVLAVETGVKMLLEIRADKRSRLVRFERDYLTLRSLIEQLTIIGQGKELSSIEEIVEKSRDRSANGVLTVDERTAVEEAMDGLVSLFEKGGGARIGGRVDRELRGLREIVWTYKGGGRVENRAGEAREVGQRGKNQSETVTLKGLKDACRKIERVLWWP
ncbi:MAG: hypothetical protein LBJ08_05295 [Bifidobacteriaceae bacterium]|jgi:hypothetical protein|nr:hypothetical protein [Bifidobacteriaceae bacterium]